MSGDTVFGVPIKHASLVILTVQNSGLILTMRHSRTLPGPQYLTSTAVVLSEVMKLVISLIIYLFTEFRKRDEPELPLLSPTSEKFESSPSKFTVQRLFSNIFGRKSGFLLLLIPAVLYTVQNNLQFVAASNLDAATFQVTYQGKILSTAFFAVLLLHQRLSPMKWFSLFLLTVGVACVQIPSGQPSTTSSSSSTGSHFIGLIAVAVACLISGITGVYFELILKKGSGDGKSNGTSSIWLRNIQLSIGCLMMALMGTAAWDGAQIRAQGFFYGYNPIVWLTICMQAIGGLIVAMVIKYADNILKGFATSLSVVLSTIASVYLYGFVVTRYFMVGMVLVLIATHLYGLPDKKKNVPRDEESIISDDEQDSMLGSVVSTSEYTSDLESGSTRHSSYDLSAGPDDFKSKNIPIIFVDEVDSDMSRRSSMHEKR